MNIPAIKKGGVNRTYERSIAQKWAFSLGHLVIVLICVWIVYFNGLGKISDVLGKSWTLVDTTRAKILLACAFLYWFRHAVTLFYLLQRKVNWSEVWGLLGFMAFFEISLVLIGGGAFRDYFIQFGFLDVVAFVLLVLGSYLNSFSEIQRKWWKRDSQNSGHCYTERLFSYSMHINYFGDTVLFTGWCLFTYNYWMLVLPLLMGGMFVFFHIPSLDAYLAERYGKEFNDYSKRTKKFIPYVY